jgi:hypothetical protein
MNIGFYGHSNCAYRSESSFLDIVAENLGAKIVNIGVRQGSEERILFELKKTKNLDLAIIFHSEAQYIFIPEADRDISIKQISTSKSNYIFDDHLNEYHKLHHKKFVELFKTAEELKSAITHLKSYFYHPDLQLNRFYGSLIQIDQYLLSKEIPVIHITIPNSIPNWFHFKSGIVNNDIMDIIFNYKTPASSWFVNLITKEGNEIVADRLLKIIKDNSLVK